MEHLETVKQFEAFGVPGKGTSRREQFFAMRQILDEGGSNVICLV